ncbi:MAG TPA: EamA family transporter [Bacteroidales bacterium]|nr:EamA family transporter [Bacteroidales bacterium]HPS26633.1 EamA family transporter [Bacteroidales bacterium]
MQKDLIKNNLLLHLVVIILGFTAILGKLIHLPAADLVWFRMLIAFWALFIFILIFKRPLALPIKSIMKLAVIGVVIAAHWICFFQAIKVSNVSVTLGCLSVTTLFTSFLEPLINRKKISLLEVIIGLIIILGIYIIFRFETRYVEGIIFTLVCAFLASLFSVLNKKIALHYEPEITTFYEMLSGFVVVTIYLLISKGSFSFVQIPSFSDLLFLLILGIVCTAFAFSATVKIMQKLSAYQVVLAINLEPVYGIIAAYFIFRESEQMTTEFYIGAAIIILSVVLYTFIKNRNKPQTELVS